MSKKTELAQAEVGSVISFGFLQQDREMSLRKEPIRWQVLAKEENRLLVISLYALDSMPYDDGNRNVTWETCSLRTWLNDEFFSIAFDEQEKVMISPDTDTADCVFLLSAAEAELYFEEDSDRLCSPTDYAIGKGTDITNFLSSPKCFWWLRTTVENGESAAAVNDDGSVHYFGIPMGYDRIAVRPAMWIDLEA